MRRAEAVEITFVTAGEAAQATELAQRGHALAPPREDLVRVGLMADIPDQAVIGGVENVMQGKGQLDRPQIGAQVPAGARYAVQQEGAQFARQFSQPGPWQSAQLGR